MGSREKRLRNECRLWDLPGYITHDDKVVKWTRQNAPDLCLYVSEHYPFLPPAKLQPLRMVTCPLKFHAWLWTALTLPGLASVIPLGSKCLCCTSVTCRSRWSPRRRLSEAFLEMEFRRQYPKFLDIPLPFLNDDLWLHVLEVSGKK